MKCRISIILIVTLLVTACGKKNDSGSSMLSPGKSTLLFPTQNSACTTGLSPTATQSTVSFSWVPADNTTSYELDIKNLLTGVTTTQIVNGTQTQIILLLNTPYSWYVISRSSALSTITQSDTWKFYNSGPGVLHYAPFPASLTSPTYNQSIAVGSGTINLTWADSAIENNIVGYDVYFGTSSTAPALLKSNVTDMFLNSVFIISASTYFWKIVTRDSNGNTADSGIYTFSVK